MDPARTSLCSAHYFDEDAGLLTQGWYEQGTRFLDVSTPSKIRQVGFWIPQKNVTWGAVFHPIDQGGGLLARPSPRHRRAAREQGARPHRGRAAETPRASRRPPSVRIRPSTTRQSCASRRARVKLKLRVRGGRRRPRGPQGALPPRRAQPRQRAGHGVRVRVRLPRLLRASARRPAPAGLAHGHLLARAHRSRQGQVARVEGQGQARCSRAGGSPCGAGHHARSGERGRGAPPPCPP